jgi:hypothetical protein
VAIGAAGSAVAGKRKRLPKLLNLRPRLAAIGVAETGVADAKLNKYRMPNRLNRA